MCGIALIICRNPNCSLDHKGFFDLHSSLKKRGPDSASTFEDKGIRIDFFRLAIRQIETGFQPFHYKSFVSVINGELDNYQTFLQQLDLEIGSDFGPYGDMQIMGIGIAEAGVNALKIAEGMFAGCIYDEKTKRVILFRDIMGEKPLFFSKDDNHFIACSEPANLLNKLEINECNLNMSIAKGYWGFGQQQFNNIQKVRPGEICFFDIASWQMKSEIYWTWEKKDSSQKSFTKKSLSEFCDNLDETITSVIEDQIQNDVPVGVLLSGGLDSTLISEKLCKVSTKNIHAFTLKFPHQDYDESKEASHIAKYLRMHHTVVEPDVSELSSFIPRVLDAMKEPILDPATISLFVLSEEVSKSHKVVLSGDGGDELFRGYSLYQNKLALNLGIILGRYLPFIGPILTKSIPLIRFLDRESYLGIAMRFERLAQILKFPNLDSLAIAYSPISGNEELVGILNQLPSQRKSELITDEKIDHLYRRNILSEVFLAKTDRMSMFNGLEIRAPLLNKRVVESVLRHDVALKSFSKKDILLKMIDSELKPLQLKKKKHGFGPPLKYYLSDFKISKEFCEFLGVLDEAALSLRNRMLEGSQNAGIAYWSLLVAENFWMKKHKK
jgi:asparagine synthase (glutamine-hydrolysing)